MEQHEDLKNIEMACLDFQELDTLLLYEIMKLRQEVFVVEQNCPYLDADGVDLSCHHVTLCSRDILVAYARIVPPGISYDTYSSIGRVVTHPSYRVNGLGTQLMTYAVKNTSVLYPDHSIKISAQTYITTFYNNIGFQEVGKEYLEDDIPHISMILEK